MALFGLSLAEPDLGQLRRRESHPRHRLIIHLCRQAKQSVADHNAGVVAGHMGELVAARNIAGGKDFLVAAP